ncbi:hypothetical protein [Marinobacter lutaoensis]|uniref:hypothetical protein n=1 Tax=Marinobacter lutaoensis TaxID=135739 RepID=UPI00111562CD|nr:hypothetical protein [Marinobacter lutaoensis]
MSDELKPVRVMIGGPSGCVGYSQDELRVLKSILAKGRTERTMIVHRAMRIMCQAMLLSPNGGYPGSLSELGLGHPGGVFQRGHGNASAPKLDDSESDSDNWLLESSSDPQVKAQVVVDDSATATTDLESTGPNDALPGDPERERYRSIASQFMG